MAKRYKPTRYSINLYYAPDPRYERNTIIQNFAGGLNIYDLPYNIASNESPNMKNLNWHDGVLCCRDGQRYVNQSKAGQTAYACNSTLYYGRVFFHIGNKIYMMDPINSPETLIDMGVRVPANRGSFFTYAYGASEYLLYKNVGGFIKIDYHSDYLDLIADLETQIEATVDAREKARLTKRRDDLQNNGGFLASNVADDAYSPLIMMNCKPGLANAGVGDQYEDENRLSPRKRVQFTADGETLDYYLPPAALGMGVDKIISVTVDGEKLKKGTDYKSSPSKARVRFFTPPSNHENLAVNNVEIEYSLTNEDAFNSIMNCRFGMSFGGTVSLCLLLAGCSAQPNAVFWNANNSVAMDPSYWPISTYNLCGDADDPVTGFGKQQQMLVVFKKNSLGRMSYDTQSANGIAYPAFNYFNINAETGCDLPWTIRLCNNNLVFCNTEQGVHYLKNSSAAYENNVECISQKVNGGVHGGNVGLLNRVRGKNVDPDSVCSIADGRRYLLCIPGGYTYEWDYELSNWEKPTWFYHTGIPAIAFFKAIDREAKLWHIDAHANITEFVRNYEDYGKAIPKKYQFPYMSFGAYDRLKDIRSVLIAIRYDRNQDIAIDWQCDYCTEHERNNLITEAGLDIAPRDLSYRDFSSTSSSDFAYVARRKPGFKHIKHFSMCLSEETAGNDLSLISAQIFYTFQGRLR